MADVYVQDGRQKKIRDGHPWIYRNEIARVEGETEDGGPVRALDAHGRLLGHGFYNGRSMITVRLLTHRDEPADASLIARRVREAVAYRDLCMRRDDTDCRRLIYGEADRLPGVICDQFGPVVVLQVLALGMERWTDEIVRALQGCVPSMRALLLKNDDAIREKEGMERFSRVLLGEVGEETLVRENGLTLRVDLRGGQKTGSFLDQKANHRFLRRFARGARVLDCFTYAGGFALNAAAAGAASVCAVDISEAACALARENAARNGLAVEVACANCFDFLRAKGRERAQYDVVVLDPPAFAKARANLDAARRGYKEIALSAMRLLPAGGVLAAHSCSYHMPEDVFVKTTLSAAQDLRRAVRVITLRRQDVDHPVLAGYPESYYLKSLWMQMLD